MDADIDGESGREVSADDVGERRPLGEGNGGIGGVIEFESEVCGELGQRVIPGKRHGIGGEGAGRKRLQGREQRSREEQGVLHGFQVG